MDGAYNNRMLQLFYDIPVYVSALCPSRTLFRAVAVKSVHGLPTTLFRDNDA